MTFMTHYADGMETPHCTDGGTEVETELFAEFEERAGNPAVTPDGRLIVSNHPFPYGETPEYRVVE